MQLGVAQQLRVTTTCNVGMVFELMIVLDQSIFRLGAARCATAVMGDSHPATSDIPHLSFIMTVS